MSVQTYGIHLAQVGERNLDDQRNDYMDVGAHEKFVKVLERLELVRERLHHLNRCIVSSGVGHDGSGWCIIVGYLPHKKEKTTQSWARSLLPHDKLVFQREWPCNLYSFLQTVEPLVAGAFIAHENSAGTLGLVFQHDFFAPYFQLDPGHRYGLTTGHLFTDSVGEFSARTHGSKVVFQGEEAKRIGEAFRGKSNSITDLTLVELDDDVDINTDETIDQQPNRLFSIPNLRVLPPHQILGVGTTVFKVGCATGGTRGSINRFSVTVQIETKTGCFTTMRGLVEVVSSRFKFSDKGDSGASCFTKIRNETIFIGTVVGGREAYGNVPHCTYLCGVQNFMHL